MARKTAEAVTDGAGGAAPGPGPGPEEIVAGVYRVETGRGLTGANVYLVRSGPGWVLIDAAWPHRAQLIKAAPVVLPDGPRAVPRAVPATAG